MVHLKPLPGSPQFCGDFDEVLSMAMDDAKTLTDAGFDGLIVENFGDIPFFPERVPIETVASMTRIVAEIQQQTLLPLGVNVLRNDAISAIAIANSTCAQFIRTNVFNGVTTSEQGWLTGQAHHIVRYRKQLGSNVLIFADVAVKHSYPIIEINLENQIVDAVQRSMADAIIISGNRTGQEPDVEFVEKAHKICSHLNVPLLVGSGVNFDNVKCLLKFADAAIVGTSLKKNNVSGPIDIILAKKKVEFVSNLRG